MRLSRGFIAALAGCAGLALGAVANGAFITVNFPLSGDQEPTPTGADSFGVGTLIVDTTAKTFDLDLFVVGIALADLAGVGPNITPVHIHNAPAGVNGGIVIDLGFFASFMQNGFGIVLTLRDIAFGGVQGALNSDIDANLAAFFAGNLYVNVHTNDFPGGEIRGQIIGPGIPAPAGASLFALAALGAVRRRR